MKGWFPLLLMVTAVALVYLKRHEIVAALSLRPLPRSPSPQAEAAASRLTPLLRAELQALGLKVGDPVFLRVFKESRELELWLHPAGSASWTFYKNYPLCAVPETPGPKHDSGNCAPEGFYFASARHLITRGDRLAIDLGFPNSYDRHHKFRGQQARIEGGCDPRDSYAAGDAAIAEIVTLARAALANGQPFFRIHCFPFRMTDARMNEELAARSQWVEFWANLKEGFDYFEILHRPPNTTVKKGRYVFE